MMAANGIEHGLDEQDRAFDDSDSLEVDASPRGARVRRGALPGDGAHPAERDGRSGGRLRRAGRGAGWVLALRVAAAGVPGVAGLVGVPRDASRPVSVRERRDGARHREPSPRAGDGARRAPGVLRLGGRGPGRRGGQRHRNPSRARRARRELGLGSDPYAPRSDTGREAGRALLAAGRASRVGLRVHAVDAGGGALRVHRPVGRRRTGRSAARTTCSPSSPDRRWRASSCRPPPPRSSRRSWSAGLSPSERPASRRTSRSPRTSPSRPTRAATPTTVPSRRSCRRSSSFAPSFRPPIATPARRGSARPAESGRPAPWRPPSGWVPPYVMTGSTNQASAEAGTSDLAKEMLAAADLTDVAMAPSPDMFEMGVKVQVLKRGTMFASRASLLRELYRAHSGLEDLPPDTVARIEREIFQRPAGGRLGGDPRLLRVARSARGRARRARPEAQDGARLPLVHRPREPLGHPGTSRPARWTSRSGAARRWARSTAGREGRSSPTDRIEASCRSRSTCSKARPSSRAPSSFAASACPSRTPRSPTTRGRSLVNAVSADPLVRVRSTPPSFQTNARADHERPNAGRWDRDRRHRRALSGRARPGRLLAKHPRRARADPGRPAGVLARRGLLRSGSPGSGQGVQQARRVPRSGRFRPDEVRRTAEAPDEHRHLPAPGADGRRPGSPRQLRRSLRPRQPGPRRLRPRRVLGARARGGDGGPPAAPRVRQDAARARAARGRGPGDLERHREPRARVEREHVPRPPEQRGHRTDRQPLRPRRPELHDRRRLRELLRRRGDGEPHAAPGRRRSGHHRRRRHDQRSVHLHVLLEDARAVDEQHLPAVLRELGRDDARRGHRDAHAQAPGGRRARRGSHLCGHPGLRQLVGRSRQEHLRPPLGGPGQVAPTLLRRGGLRPRDRRARRGARHRDEGRRPGRVQRTARGLQRLAAAKTASGRRSDRSSRSSVTRRRPPAPRGS